MVLKSKFKLGWRKIGDLDVNYFSMDFVEISSRKLLSYSNLKRFLLKYYIRSGKNVLITYPVRPNLASCRSKIDFDFIRHNYSFCDSFLDGTRLFVSPLEKL